MTESERKRDFFLWSLSLLSVNIKLESLWTHLEAISLSLSPQYKRTLTCCAGSHEANARQTRIHSSRMRTSRSLLYRGDLPNRDTPPLIETPGQRPSMTEIPPGQRPRPGQRPCPGQRPPCHVTCDACWDRDPPPVNRMTHRCKNITLSQTSFAGGKNWHC